MNSDDIEVGQFFKVQHMKGCYYQKLANKMLASYDRTTKQLIQTFNHPHNVTGIILVDFNGKNFNQGLFAESDFEE